MIWNVQPLLPKTKIGKVRDEPKTIGVADLWHPLCYQDDNDWVPNWPFYPNHVIRGSAVE